MTNTADSSGRTSQEEKKLKEILAVTETEDSNSLLEMAIRKLPLGVCATFQKDGQIVPAQFLSTGKIIENNETEKLAQVFPQTIAAHGNRLLTANGPSSQIFIGKRIAVLFSGGPASGGHNVLVGIKKVLGSNNTLLGILSGPRGLLKGFVKEITDDDVVTIINTGGFKYLGTDRTKIENDEQVEQIKKVVRKEKIDGIIAIGGDDTNTTVAYLAEKLFSNVHDDGRGVPVIGVPKTIDGDLQIENILPISFGFDTATKTYAEMVGNILVDSASSLKYWHFVKLMGRSASHVALEVALQVKPAIALVSEEIAEKNQSLHGIIEYITNIILLRASKGINHGVMIIPEGLIEFIPEIRVLIDELNEVMAKNHEELHSMTDMKEKKEFIFGELSDHSAKLLATLPDDIEDMLLMERDSHGNLQVSQVPTEKLLNHMCRERIHYMQSNIQKYFPDLTPEEEKAVASYTFAINEHFFGYDGRGGFPTKFDMAYSFNLGANAASLALAGISGCMATVSQLDKGGQPWAIPLTSIIHFERRSGKDKPVIAKALVETSSPAFQYFQSRRDEWALSDKFCSPGPIQFWGPVANQLPMTVALNTGYDFRSFDLGRETPFLSEYDCKIFKFQEFCKTHGLAYDEKGLFEENGLLNYQVVSRYRLNLGTIVCSPGSTLVINELGEVFQMVPMQPLKKKKDS